MYLNPFEILVDRNERPAYTFQNLVSDKTGPGKGAKIFVPSTRVVLAFGDYSIAHHVRDVVVERKTVVDLIQCCTTRHAWFKRKMDELQSEVEHPFVVIEAGMREILAKCKSPETYRSISRSRISWAYRFPKVSWFFVDGRRQAEVCTFRLLERYWKILIGEV